VLLLLMDGETRIALLHDRNLCLINGYSAFLLDKYERKMLTQPQCFIAFGNVFLRFIQRENMRNNTDLSVCLLIREQKESFCRYCEWKNVQKKHGKWIWEKEKRRNKSFCFRSFSPLISSFHSLISCFLVRNWKRIFSVISKSSQDWRIFLFERRVRFVVQWKISFVKKSHFKYNYIAQKRISGIDSIYFWWPFSWSFQ